jgi:Fe2+ transport system protein B
LGTTIKCHHCGTYNVDVAYCEHCHELIDVAKRRELEQTEAQQRRTDSEQQEKEKITATLDRYRNHKYLPVRLLAGLSYYTWAAIMAIGAFLAWLIAMVAA